VATTPNGVVYIADSDINRVRRVLTSGTIETIASLRHPKAPYALRTATGHDLVVPEWNGRTVVRLTGVDSFGGGPPPADTTAPTVTAVDPASAATGVPVGTNVAATFSRACRPAPSRRRR
jgi:hypothetical protein